MIEVEVRFHLPEEKYVDFVSEATFVSETSFTDTYYDTQGYALSIQDIWLRMRDDKFMLKLPATHSGQFNLEATSPMHEIENEAEIRKALGICDRHDIKEAIEMYGYKPLYSFVSTRRKYKKDKFCIDIDHVDYGLFTYDICEVELMVESSVEVQDALQEIYSFLSVCGIPAYPIDGKLVYMIKRVNPDHFRILQEISSLNS